MILLITPNKKYLELPEDVEMYQDENKKWWWKKFFIIDGVHVENPDFTKYSLVYEDYKKPITGNSYVRKLKYTKGLI